MVESFEVLAKMGGVKGIVIQDNIHDDKTIGKSSQINKCMRDACANILKGSDADISIFMYAR